MMLNFFSIHVVWRSEVGFGFAPCVSLRGRAAPVEPPAIRPMRPMAPLQASIASLSSVLPDDACPTMAKLRMFAEGCVAITPRMRRKWLVCKFHERKVAIDGNVHRWSFGVLGSAGCALWP